jgi:hypothetical protein
MPSVNAGQLASGVRRVSDFSGVPGLDFFAGYNLGAESETQAMIKWLDYYVPKASLYIDLHQQGGIEYYNKPFASSRSDSLSKTYARKNNAMLKGGYKLKPEPAGYGLNGDGGTLTDYAVSIAEGFKYSYAYGRMALDMGGVETPLIVFKDIDNFKQYYKPLNAAFRCISIEIGRKPSYLGAGAGARLKRKNEYDRYGWGNFLAGTVKNVLGAKKVSAIKAGST